MTRPALVIGLGGTGQWVLTFLKKDLLEIGGGQMPAGVRLLAFDTTSGAMAKAGQRDSMRKEDQEAIRAGAVELEDGTEFIPIGQNVSQLVSQIASGEHPHLQWFPADTFQAKLPPAAFNTKEGSGQIRQMGRISVFRDLSARANSKILSHLRQAILGLQDEVSRDRQLEIIIVGSLAGGTGAGMLVDMALLVRAQARELVQEHHIVRGFFVLPRAFSQGGLGQHRDMFARSFATWRELDRFMIVSERFGLRQINYHPQNRSLQIRVDKRAYDVSYMVDPVRQTANSLDNVDPEEGLYPALAHGLSAILDEQAGQAYTEFVATNLAGKLAQLPRRPYHSAIGTYTLKVPVYYAHEKFSHQLALEALRELLAPEVNQSGRAVRLSELRNREVPDGHAGKTAVLDFMSASALNIDGQEIPNTMYLPLVAEIREREGQRDGAMINQWARGGLTHMQSRVLRAMTNIGQDEEGKLIQRDITDELQLAIWQEVPPSRVIGDSPDRAYTRIKNQIPQVRSEHYGLDTAGGERLRGTYGKALAKVQNAQIARYNQLLRAWTANALNGQSEDPIVARGGKLGYVRTFYDELINTFTYFLGFLNKVRQERNETLKIGARMKEAADRARLHYERERDKSCWLTFWDDFTHPDAHRAQREYLRAEQRNIDVRKDDILLDVLAETATEMREIARQTLEEVDRWIVLLATGAADGEGLYNAAAESLDNVNVNHEWDKRQERVTELIGEHEYQSDPEHLSEAVSKFRWQVSEGKRGVALTCGLELPTGRGDDEEASTQFKAFRKEGEEVTERNLNLLLRLGEEPYHTLHRDRPLATEVAKIYERGTDLARGVDKKAEPLYAKVPTEAGPQFIACYVRVRSDVNEESSAYFQDFRDQLSKLNPNISNLSLEDSEDPHKMTIVRSNDLLPSTDFEMWHKCREAYIELVNDPYTNMNASELHIFPAEINACYYEARLPAALAQDYRTLHPEVAALLGNRERFEMFFRAYALGYIREVTDEETGSPYWIYQLSEEDDPLRITLPYEGLEGVKREDIFQVIHNFAMDGRDQRAGVGQTRRIDWDRLRTAILTKQRQLGNEKAIDAYQKQIDDPEGMVRQITADVEQRRAAIQEKSLRETIGQEHQDLADVAQYVYMQAIESLS